MSCNRDTLAIVMAAGFSRRFGDDKRQLKLTDEHTLLAHATQIATDTFAKVWVVIREDDNPAALGLSDTTQTLRVHDAHLGLSASLASAFSTLCQLTDQAKACAVFLGDMPFVNRQVCQALCHKADMSTILRPTFNGKPGHPVIFGRDFWPEIVNLKPDETGQSIIQRHQHHYLEIPVNDAGVCRDIDTPEDLGSL